MLFLSSFLILSFSYFSPLKMANDPAAFQVLNRVSAVCKYELVDFAITAIQAMEFILKYDILGNFASTGATAIEHLTTLMKFFSELEDILQDFPSGLRHWNEQAGYVRQVKANISLF